MAELAATFATHTELAPILESVTNQAVRLIGDVDFADILLVDEDGHRSLAPTAPITVDLDTVQIDAREGPSVAARKLHVKKLFGHRSHGGGIDRLNESGVGHDRVHRATGLALNGHGVGVPATKAISHSNASTRCFSNSRRTAFHCAAIGAMNTSDMSWRPSRKRCNNPGAAATGWCDRGAAVCGRG